MILNQMKKIQFGIGDLLVEQKTSNHFFDLKISMIISVDNNFLGIKCPFNSSDRFEIRFVQDDINDGKQFTSNG
jgi:hypothetical protein